MSSPGKDRPVSITRIRPSISRQAMFRPTCPHATQDGSTEARESQEPHVAPVRRLMRKPHVLRALREYLMPHEKRESCGPRAPCETPEPQGPHGAIVAR